MRFGSSLGNGGLAAHLHRLALRLLSLALLLRKAVDKLFTRGLVVEAGLIQPWVLPDLLDRGALAAIFGEKSENQLLEVAGKVNCVGLLEVKISLTSADQVVEVLLASGLLKREDALHDDEQDHSEAEHVNFLSVVLLSLLNLRGHVREGAPVALKAFDLLVAREAEVSDLQVHLLVDKDVLQLQVTVNNLV